MKKIILLIGLFIATTFSVQAAGQYVSTPVSVPHTF